MQGNNWEASERELKDRCEKARKELSETLILLDTTKRNLNEARKVRSEQESLTDSQKSEYGRITHAINGATIDYKQHTDIVLRLKQENATIEQKNAILNKNTENYKKNIEDLQFDVNKTENLLKSLHLDNSRLKIENQNQIQEIEKRNNELKVKEQEYLERERKISEREEYIQKRQIDIDNNERLMRLKEKRLNELNISLKK